MTEGFHKGDRVRVILTRKYQYHVKGMRATTSEENWIWQNSSASRGQNDAGETKLQTKLVCSNLLGGVEGTVTRGRCAPVLGFHRRQHMALILFDDGQELFVKRASLELI